MQSNKRMQSDRSTRYASETAANAERYGLKEPMKYVYKATTIEGANEIKTLLENAGIPASISNSNFASLNLSFIPTKHGYPSIKNRENSNSHHY